MLRSKEFWEFMQARETIRLRRFTGQKAPWSDDQVFQLYSFTNVKREHDRVSRVLMREFYAPRGLVHPSPQALLNATLFRFFGSATTALLMGWHAEWSPGIAKDVAFKNEKRMMMGEKVFTSAYVVPSAGFSSKCEAVCQVASEVWQSSDMILTEPTWQGMTQRMKQINNIGSFMAKEVLLDYIMATGWTPEDWKTWTPVGPGGKRGALRVRDGGLYDTISETEALVIIRQLYDQRFQEWPKTMSIGDSIFSSVALDLTDIQFQLCEFDKYNRANEGRRPKRYFRPTSDRITVGGFE